MHLTLVRHGEAAPALGDDDHYRPLTPIGHAQAKQTADFIKNRLVPEVFVVSPLLRAQETLEHIRHYFPNTPILLCDKIKPDDDAKEAIEWLSQLSFESIVVVCHMNIVGYIAQLLTDSDFNAFSLAEARIYRQNLLTQGLSTQIDIFSPSI